MLVFIRWIGRSVVVFLLIACVHAYMYVRALAYMCQLSVIYIEI